MKDDRKMYGSVGAGQIAGKDPGLIVGISTKAFLLVVGLFILGMLTMIPCWSAVIMLEDPITMQFIGPKLPKVLFGSCLGVLSLFLVSTVLFFNCARPEAVNEQSFLMTGNIFLVALGTALVLTSMPLGTQSENVFNSLFIDCEQGAVPGSFELYGTSQVLQALRQQPECKAMVSVEDCHGYKATPYATLLKSMEAKLKCSGFCYNSQGVNETADLMAAQTVAAEGNSTDADGQLEPKAAFLQAGSAAVGQPDQVALLAARGQGDRAVAAVAAARGGAVAEGAGRRSGSAAVAQAMRGVVLPYPPTLFSNANYEASCDGMVARHIQYGPGEVSVQLFYEGIFLMLTSLVVGMLKLCGMCMKGRSIGKAAARFA